MTPTLDTPTTPAERILAEGPISMSKAARLLPGGRGGTGTHPATMTRWVLAGCTGLDGRRHRLEAVRAGSKWLTSEAAVVRFLNILSTPAAAAGPGPRTPAERTRAQLRAAAELDALGV